METTLFENPDAVAKVVEPTEQPINTCDQCGTPFPPRAHGGGSQKRFCNDECRATWHAEHPKAQRSPACSDETETPLVPVAPKPEIAPAERKWDWVDDRGDVIVPSQPAIALYWNVRGNLMLRQEGMLGDEEDQFIAVQPRNLPVLIERLQTEYDSWKRDYGGA
jgi:hypothetical protein